MLKREEPVLEEEAIGASRWLGERVVADETGELPDQSPHIIWSFW